MTLAVDDGVNGLSSVRFVALAALDMDGRFKANKGHHGAPVVMDYATAVAHGLIDGAAPYSSNGEYEAGGAVTDFPVHSAGAVNISLTGVQMSFVSSSVNDAAAGTGLRTLLMSYIEHSTLAAKTEVIAMNGTTPVLSVATNIRFINSLTMLTAGSGGKNAGAITVTNGGLTYGGIATGRRVQMSAYRMVPAGKVFYPDTVFASSNSGSAATKAVFHLVGWSPSVPYWLPSNAIGVQDSPFPVSLREGRGVTEGSVFGVEVETDKAAHLTASIIGRLENAI